MLSFSIVYEVESRKDRLIQLCFSLSQFCISLSLSWLSLSRTPSSLTFSLTLQKRPNIPPFPFIYWGSACGVYFETPHSANSLYIGIPSNLCRMWNLLPFSCFLNRVQQKAQQLLLLRLTNRAIASFTSS